MGSIAKTFVENMTWNNYKSTWEVNLSMPDIAVTGSTFSLQAGSGNAKFTYSGKDRAASAILSTVQCNSQILATSFWGRPFRYPMDDVNAQASSSGVAYSLNSNLWQYSTSAEADFIAYSGNHSTSDFFTASNKTSRSLPIRLYCKANTNGGSVVLMSLKSDGSLANQYANVNTSTGDRVDYDWGNIANLTLDVPPTATISELSVSGSRYYTNITTISVSISNLTAYYGGDFTTTTEHPAGVKFEIGNQSDERHNNGTLSIALDSAGTFTPKVTVTDSRGQTYVKTFDPITVQEYNPTTNITTLLRVNATGEPEDDPAPGHFSDEGTNAVVACVFDYPIIASNYMKRPVVKIDGQSPTNTVNWYTSWTENGGFSGQVSFSSYNPTRPVALYGKITDTLETDQSYEISVACNTTLGTGSTDAQTLPQAFYLLSAAAGGHGLGIGMKVPPSANGQGLHVDMDATFYKTTKFKQAPGIIKMYAGNSAPDGWLLCDGSAVSRTDYSLLYAVIGTTYGSGDGSTTFNLPDLRGAFAVGAGNNIAVGDTGGEENHTLTVNEIPSHQHETNITAGGTGGSTNAGYVSWTSGRQSNMYQATTMSQPGSHTPVTTDQPHNNMPPYTAVNYIISTGEPSENSDSTDLPVVRGVLVDGQSVVNSDGIAEIVNDNRPIIKTSQQTCTFTGSTYMTFTVPYIAGYTCIGIIGWLAGGGYTAGYANFDFHVDVPNQKIHVSNTNYYSGYEVTAKLLYVRSDVY